MWEQTYRGEIFIFIKYKLQVKYFQTILVMIVKDYFQALINFVLMMIFVMIFYKLTYISLAVNISYCCYSTSQHNHLDIHLDTLHWGGHIVHSLYIACYNFLCSSFHNVLADTLYKDECFGQNVVSINLYHLVMN